MQRQGTPIDPLLAEVRAAVASVCDGCVVTKGINPDSERTQCVYDGFSGAQHEPWDDESDPIGGYLLITPGVPLVLLTGPVSCDPTDPGGTGGSGEGGTGGSGEGGTGGSGEGGTGGPGEGGTGGSGEGGTGGTGEGGTGGSGEGGTGGTGEGGAGGSGAGVTETPETGDGAAAP
ncbi:hypothetical protein [Nocardia cyriacigeorgica]|uniref:hypothetical protein n=1 Tax=Nocardia cyriacigeorgica TaxID=135487 RepID=UPI001895D758|nr:hypothetical protein [Nocardia cyriacigeorgica]MBF6435376.1 hypothetical protein [Nocardia cyriacigeorgica]